MSAYRGHRLQGNVSLGLRRVEARIIQMGMCEPDNGWVPDYEIIEHRIIMKTCRPPRQPRATSAPW